MWFFLLGLQSLWSFGYTLIGIKHILDLGPLINAIIFWSLANGLINRNNGSRQWAIFWTVLGFLFFLFLAGVAAFEGPDPMVGFHFGYEKLTRTQTIVLIVVGLPLHTGILFILLRPATKALFVPPITQNEAANQG
jgi:hypothetical protein